MESTVFWGQCSGATNIPLNGTINVNGVNITTASNGDITTYPNAFTSCAYQTAANSLWVGRNTSWTVMFTFDQAVNDIEFVITASGGGANEDFTFVTSIGIPSITDLGSCFSTITGNTILSGAGAGSSGGGGHFRISNNAAYTSLTMSGNGGTNGSLVSVCTLSITPVPMCNANSNAPSFN